MSELAVRVDNLRVGPYGQVLAFFNLVFGTETDDKFVGLFVVKDFALKKKNDGGFWFQSPGKPRKKDGKIVEDENGYQKWDDYFDLYWETDSSGKRSASKASWKFKDYILEQVVAAFTAVSEIDATTSSAKSQRAKAPAKAATRTPAAAATATARTTGDTRKASPLDDEDFPDVAPGEYDDLPF